MNRQEYLTNRFRKDFLQYSLLQTDSAPAEDIAEKLFGTIDLKWLMNSGKREIERLCQTYFHSDKAKVDGKYSNELTEEWNIDVMDKAIAGYQNFLDEYPTEQITAEIVTNIKRSIELQTWSHGIIYIPHAIKLLVKSLEEKAGKYGKLHSSAITAEAVNEYYNKAKEITFFERIKGDNVEDILNYRSALRSYVQESCMNMLHSKMQQIFTSVAYDSVFFKLQSNFNAFSDYAHKLEASIVKSEQNDEWDNEYNSLVPTDFYYRNVENITAEKAFQMVLLKFFADNEDWMIENGLLSNNELHVYTGPDASKLAELLSKIEGEIM